VRSAQASVVRETRMRRLRRRGLETEPRRSLSGHAGGNPGYRQGNSYGSPRQPSTRQTPILRQFREQPQVGIVVHRVEMPSLGRFREQLKAGTTVLKHSPCSKRRRARAVPRFALHSSTRREWTEVVVADSQAARRRSITGRCLLPATQLTSSASRSPPGERPRGRCGHRALVA
jgi:hypothetical protein